MVRVAVGQRILGIDPGLNVTGYGIVDITTSGVKVIEAGVIRGRDRSSLENRLLDIHRGMCEILDAFKPVAVSLEELYSHYERPRTSILMGHARGVICLAACERQLPIFPYAATQIKKILTGNGRAPKPQIQNAICRELGLLHPPEPADVADALAIALCHCYLGGREEAA